MNERIAELMVEAGKTVPGDKHIDADFCNKFAELILKECISICENNEYPKNPDLFEHGWDGGLQAAQERMMNHFGVDL